MEYKKIKEINEYKSESINPMKTPDTMYELYSVPFFTTGHPEYLHESEIGSSKVTVQKNDILVCKINPRINRVWVVADESNYQSIASSEWIVVRTAQHNPYFLAWYFRTPMFQQLMTSEVTGIGGSLTRAQPKRVAEYPVPVLSREKQDKIVSILDRLESIKRERKSELDLLDSLVKARFVEMFEGGENQWGQKKLVECCNNKNDIKCGPFGSQLHVEDYQNVGIPVYGIPEVNSGFKTNPKLYVSRLKAEELSSYNLIPGDVAVSRKGNVGQAALFHDELKNGIIHSDVLRIRLNEQILNPLFLIGELHFSQGIRNQVMQASNGAIMPGTNVTKLKKIIIDVPPLSMQMKYSTLVQQVEKSKFTIDHCVMIIKKALQSGYHYVWGN